MIRTTIHQRLLFTVAAAICSACASSSGATAQPASQAAPRTNPAEEQAVLATVQRLFDAMRTKDTAAFRELFEPNAKLVGMPAGWKIVSIADTYEPTGCPAREPPR